MEEPVHDDEQDRDRDEPGDRLETIAVLRELREDACMMNQVPTAAAKAIAAPRAAGRRMPRWTPSIGAITAARMRTASSPSRKTMIALFATITA